MPTTRYLCNKTLPASAHSVGNSVLRLEPAHWPLVFMLILTQFAAGLHLFYGVLFSAGWTEPLPVLARFAMCALSVGLVASVAHLGRPLKAWRAFLGWRHSWMSREIIGFNLYAMSGGLLVCFPGNALLAKLTALTAIAAVGCSAMIYVDTKRPVWGAATVFTKFFGTALLLGATGGAVWAAWLAPSLAPLLATIATVVRVILFTWEMTTLLRAKSSAGSPSHRNAQLIFTVLLPIMVARSVLFLISTIFSAMAIFDNAQLGLMCAGIALLGTIAAQVLERYMFFVASAAPRMPGVVE